MGLGATNPVMLTTNGSISVPHDGMVYVNISRATGSGLGPSHSTNSQFQELVAVEAVAPLRKVLQGRYNQSYRPQHDLSEWQPVLR